ncbi:hypothetical protein B0H11DRAFT_1914961 [Mycena galericulata]|nr:hypothetical protein B0H11DRAFT_1914961 [Mycena galericulata]
MRPLGLQDELEILSAACLGSKWTCVPWVFKTNSKSQVFSAACMGSKRARFDQHPRPALPLFTSLTGGADRAIVPRRPVFGELDKIVDRRHALLLPQDELAISKVRVRYHGFNAVRMISWDLVPFTSSEILRPKAQVLETKDEDFSSAISGLSVITQSPLEAAAHLYRSALRVSQICRRYQMTVAARRVFTDDDEQHRVRRGHDLLTLTESLTEAIEDEVMLPHSTASLPAEGPPTPTNGVNEIQFPASTSDFASMHPTSKPPFACARIARLWANGLAPGGPKDDPAQYSTTGAGWRAGHLRAQYRVIPAVPHLTTISNATRGMASDPEQRVGSLTLLSPPASNQAILILSCTLGNTGVSQDGFWSGKKIAYFMAGVLRKVFAALGAQEQRALLGKLQTIVGLTPQLITYRQLLISVDRKLQNYYIWPLALFEQTGCLAVVDLLNRQLASTPRPFIIGPVEVTSFDFGTSPDTESVHFAQHDESESGGEFVKGTEGTEGEYSLESVSRRAAEKNSLNTTYLLMSETAARERRMDWRHEQPPESQLWSWTAVFLRTGSVPPHRTLRFAVLNSTRNLFLTQSSRRLCTLSFDDDEGSLPELMEEPATTSLLSAPRSTSRPSRPPFFSDALDAQPLISGSAPRGDTYLGPAIFCTNHTHAWTFGVADVVYRRCSYIQTRALFYPAANRGIPIVSKALGLSKAAGSKAIKANPDVDELDFDVSARTLESYGYSTGRLLTSPTCGALVDLTVWESHTRGSRVSVHLGWFLEQGHISSLAIKKICLGKDWANRWKSTNHAVWLEGARLTQSLSLWNKFKALSFAAAHALPRLEILPTFLVRSDGYTSWMAQPWVEGIVVADYSLNLADPEEAAIHEALTTFSHFTYEVSHHTSVYVEFQGGSEASFARGDNLRCLGFKTETGYQVFDCRTHLLAEKHGCEGWDSLGNSGKPGLRAFRTSHKCTGACVTRCMVQDDIMGNGHPDLGRNRKGGLCLAVGLRPSVAVAVHPQDVEEQGLLEKPASFNENQIKPDLLCAIRRSCLQRSSSRLSRLATNRRYSLEVVAEVVGDESGIFATIEREKFAATRGHIVSIVARVVGDENGIAGLEREKSRQNRGKSGREDLRRESRPSVAEGDGFGTEAVFFTKSGVRVGRLQQSKDSHREDK